MMRIFSSLAALLVLSAFAFTASAQNSSPSLFKEAADFTAQKERDSKIGESALAPIRSTSELNAYLSSRKTSPFDALSDRSRKIFVESLVFTELGLASYRFRELESELTPRQAFELLSLFGAQKTVGYLHFERASAEERQAVAKLAPIFFDDHKGYRCVPPATCQASMDNICIGANCGMYPP